MPLRFTLLFIGVNLRDFIFSIYCSSGETSIATIAALKTIAANQYEVISGGGKQLLSATVNGQSYNYSVSNGIDSMQIVALARRGYMTIKLMNDSELESYLTTIENNFVTADFSRLDVQ